MYNKCFKVLIVGFCFMFFISFGIVQPVNALEWQEKDFSSDFDSDLKIYNPEVVENELEILKDEQNEMIYHTVEDGKTFEYHEKIDKSTVHTKRYELNNSNKTLVEDYETNVHLVGEILTLNTFDNLNKTTEQVEMNLGVSNNLESNIVTMSSCVNVWPSGYTGKTVSKFAGHAYAKNYKTNKGISRLGMRDIIVNIPDKSFDQYTKIVDSLVSQEKNAVLSAFGVGALDQIIKASKKGVSLSTFKVILKQVLKSVPGVGAVTALYSYINTYHKANVARDRLKGSIN